MTHAEEPMTPIDLDELDRLCAAATPGEWCFRRQNYRNGQTGRSGTHFWITQSDGETTLPMDSAGDPRAEHNAEFIARARTALPALLAEIKRLRAELDEAAQTINMLGELRR